MGTLETAGLVLIVMMTVALLLYSIQSAMELVTEWQRQEQRRHRPRKRHGVDLLETDLKAG